MRKFYLKLLPSGPIKLSRSSTQVMRLAKKQVLLLLLAAFALFAQDGIKKVTLAEANAAITAKTGRPAGIPTPISASGALRPLRSNPLLHKWGDRRELNSRSWSHNPTPQPLGHGHIWCLRERSNLRVRLFRPALVHLSYAGKFGGDGENRTLIGWVQANHPPVERRPHGCGGGNRTQPNGGL